MAIRPHIVAKGGGVDDAVAHQRHAQFFGEFAIRRPIAGRLDAKPALQRLKTPLQFLLDPGIARIRQQMVIAVMADLVPGPKNGLRHRGMRIDRPAGDEERRLQIELIEQFQKFRRSDARLVAAIAHGDRAAGHEPRPCWSRRFPRPHRRTGTSLMYRAWATDSPGPAAPCLPELSGMLAERFTVQH